MSELTHFKAAITDMDAMAQEGFSQIAAISRALLAAMESPHFCRTTETIPHALEAITTIAEMSENSINVCAEGVGCNFIDKNCRRRCEADYLRKKTLSC